MARSTALVLCLVLAVLVHSNLAGSASQVAQQGMRKTSDAIKVTTEGLKNDLAAQIPLIGELLDLTPVTKLIGTLRPLLLQLVVTVDSTLEQTVGQALTTILNAVDAITNALEGLSPILDQIVQALAGILEKVLALVQSLLQAVLNLLGNLTGPLNKLLGGLLEQVSTLAGSLLDSVVGALSSQLPILNGALVVIDNFVIKSLLPKVAELPGEVLTLAVNVLCQLFSLETLLSGSIERVLELVFGLLATLEEALEGLLTPLTDVVGNLLGGLLGGNGLLGGLLGGRRRRYVA